MKQIKFLSFIVGGFIGLFSCTNRTENKVLSPDGRLICTIENVNDSLFICLNSQGVNIIKKSPLLVDLNGENIKWTVQSSNESSWKDTVKMSLGEKALSVSDVNQNVISLKGSTVENKNIEAELYLRALDGVLAYRLNILSLQKKNIIEEKSKIFQSSLSTEYFMSNGEREPLGNLNIDKLSDKRKYISPVFWKNENLIVGFHESGLNNYPYLTTRFDKDENSLNINPGKAIMDDDVEFPWRVFTIGNSWQELHNKKHVTYSLNKPADGNFDWIKPGISMWDWRVRGCSFNNFTYGLNTESIKRFIDFCAQNGLDYCLIDDGWYESDNPLKPIENIDIDDIVKYGNEKGVGLLLYYDLKYMKNTHKEVDFALIAETYSKFGAKGIKYGFLGIQGTKYNPQEKVRKTLDIIKIAAENKLVVDFHDSPIPFSGLERTYPNYISREFCHAQMDSRRAFTPRQFVKMACVNLFAGAMDQSNGVYELYKIKERSKGPKNEFNSTIASENARFFITHTGHLSVLLDAPEAYSNKSDMFEFVKNLPDVWDDTRYLDMDFSSHVSVARRRGDTWFLGTVYSEEGGKCNLKLDFLDKNTEYVMTLYKDADNTHYIDNKEAYEIKKLSVNNKSELIVDVTPGGGFSAILKKKTDE